MATTESQRSLARKSQQQRQSNRNVEGYAGDPAKREGRDKKREICLANKRPKPAIESRQTGTQRISGITLYLETSERLQADQAMRHRQLPKAQCGH
jgi:hypothetical protein